jgi:hypothetical protein
LGKSIIQPERACYITGTTYGLDLHHCIHGSNRRKADKLGLTVWLRHDIHMALHAKQKPFERLDEELKKVAQRAYEKKIGTREDFLREFGRNYL